MDKQIYQKALKEVYEVLNCSSAEVIKKLPIELIEYIMNNMDKKYNFEYDLKKKLTEQNLMEESKSILDKIYEEYLIK